MSGPQPLLETRRVSKQFGGVVALREVSLSIAAGNVTCLLGDNGAGKSTLIKIVAGVHPPSAGVVLVDGLPVRFSAPREALARGIATVYQDLALVPLMSVWRNFFLGAEPTRGRGPLRRLDVKRCRSVTRDQLGRLGIAIPDTDRAVGTLSGGERQSVAIARALYFGARLLILDEPTAALGVRQAEMVLQLLGQATRRGAAVLLVTHNPRHAHAAADRIVVLRRGRVIADRDKRGLTQDELAALMAGDG